MSKRIINATGPQTSFNYGVNGARLYFNYYVEYEEPSGAGTINPSTLKTTLVYQKPGPLNTIQYVESARLRADGTWLPLKENEARVINPPSPGNPNGSIGNVVNPNSSNYILGASTINELTAKGPNTLNYASRQNAASVVNKSTSLTLNQVNQAYYISQSTAPGGAQINPVLPLSPALPPAPPLSPDPSADPPPKNLDIGEDFTLTAEQKQAQGFSENSPSILVYPRDHGNSGFDFLQVRALEYVPGIGNLKEIPTNGITPVQQRIPKTNQIGPTVCLPMTPGISESNSIGWGSDELNPVQAGLGNVAIGMIDRLGSDPKAVFDIGTFSGLIGQLGNIADAPGIKQYVAAYFGGQAVQANLVGRSGIVINPNMELLFQGPKLRSFRYSFKFTPRDSLEAKEIRRIIRFFKKTSAPKRPSGSLFLGVPSIYELKYIYNSGTDGTKEHPFLNKLKLCALTSFNINYTPDGSYMTYNPTKDGGGGSMTSYTVDMQFDELEPIYNEDISQDLESETMDY